MTYENKELTMYDELSTCLANQMAVDKFRDMSQRLVDLCRNINND